jgi:DHA1 family putative efflux transporter-like MFS transporter
VLRFLDHTQNRIGIPQERSSGVGQCHTLVQAVIDMMAVDLGVTTSEIGLMVTGFALSAAIAAPILIALTMNMDRKRLLLITLGIFIASNGLMLLQLSYNMMLAIRILQGASGGVATVVAMAIATRLVEKEKRGNAIGIILMGLSSSLVLGVPVGTFFSERFGWRVLFVLIALLSLIPAAILFKKVPSIKEKETVSLRMQLAILKDVRILTALAITLGYVGGYATLFTYITPFLQETTSLSITQISGVLFLAGVCSFIGSRAGGQLADRKGPRFTIALGLLAQGAMLLLFSLAGVHMVILMAVFMVFMLATWSISPAQQLLLVNLVPRSPDIALSVNTSFIQFGFALGSGLGGLVIRHASILHLNGAGLVPVGVALLLALLLFTKLSPAKARG